MAIKMKYIIKYNTLLSCTNNITREQFSPKWDLKSQIFACVQVCYDCTNQVQLPGQVIRLSVVVLGSLPADSAVTTAIYVYKVNCLVTL